MKTNRTISRVTEGSNPYGFSRLRKEGIEISQELSGAAWTDYNFHDPGVTILEQVCFGLTDLIYRTKFEVADYLCDESGAISASAMGLHSPADVFFGRPSTPIDYQKALLDMANGVSDVQVFGDSLSPRAGGYGLYSIQVRKSVDSQHSNSTESSLVEQTASNYHSMRNLCEDIGKVLVIQEIDCYLEAQISVKPGYRVASVLAEILFTASKELTRSVHFKSFSAGLSQGLALDDVFDGPFTQHGLIDDKEMAHSDNLKNKQLLESAILSAARKIAGVEYILALRLQPVEADLAEESDSSVCKYRLVEPVSMADIASVVALSKGRRASFALDEFRAQYETFQFANKGKAFSLSEDTTLAPPPRGTYRNLKSYQSVQNQFPAAYGINQFGVPENYSPERKAQALQLKSYLLLFEQIMANYLANLGSIRQLFSIKDNGNASYFSGVLSNKEISNLDRVYPKNAEVVLDDMLGKIDDFVNRKSRLLDYLLAMYGEEFSQDSLRSFNYYHSDKQLERNIIFNKIRLLNRIKYASGDRAGGVNVLHLNSVSNALAADDVGVSQRLESASGLQFRVSIFLGFRNLAPRSLVREVFRYGLDLFPHDECTSDSDKPARVRSDSFVARARILMRQQDKQTEEDKRHYEFMVKRYLQLEPLEGGKLSESILRAGVFEANYVYDDDSGELSLNLDNANLTDGVNESIRLLTSNDAKFIADQRKCLRQLLIHINSENEGMHVVEHILLRPSNFNEKTHDFKQKFANRISVVFPAWTARCSDPHFRAYAQELVRENTPAHIHADVYWLDFSQMCEFEVLQHNWHAMLAEHCQSRQSASLDSASRALSRFLELQKSKSGLFTSHGSEFEKLRQSVEREISNYTSKLVKRRNELEFSQRRNPDAEQSYLRGIERLQAELKKIKVCAIEHMQLTPKNSEIHSDGWDFYVANVSIVLPKLFSFRPTAEQAAPFHELKTIIEGSVRRSINSSVAVAFHWIIPIDMWQFQQKYSKWQQLLNDPGSQPAEFDRAANELKNALLQLNANAEKTFDIHEWVSVLGSE
jgi:hypothetical protein